MPKDIEADDQAVAGEGASSAEATTDAQTETLAASDAPPEAKEVAPTWPEDWRQQLAGDDEKRLKELQRFQSPADVYKSWAAANQRIRSGELKTPLPENATDEQLAEFRKANGIPEKAEGYLDALPEGLVIGDDDRPMVDDFVAKMHERNASPGAVSEALGWYYAEREKRMTDLQQEDKGYRRESEDALRAEWGNEYRSNLNSMKGLLDTAPEGIADEFLGGRGSSGKLLGDNPQVLKWLVSLSSEVNPAGTVVPGAGMGQIDTIQSEITKIEKVMREDRKTYNADTKMQERLRKLYDAEEKLKKRA